MATVARNNALLDTLSRRSAVPAQRAPAAVAVAPQGGIGVILNWRAHKHLRRTTRAAAMPAHVRYAAPRDRPALAETLRDYARAGIRTLVISGGDGTIRDVLSAMPVFAGARTPRLVIVPSGKTNALAGDLGIPATHRLEDAIDGIDRAVIVRRAPIVVERAGDEGAALSGFLFGAGGFVRATALAQETHRRGAFNGLAVGLTLAAAMAQSAFGGADNAWRRGEAMRLGIAGAAMADAQRYLLMATTLERLPTGIRPFGRPRPGMKLFEVDAPPRSLAIALSSALTGYDAPWLSRFGVRRRDVRGFEVELPSGFVLDGEHYAGGTFAIRQGEPIEFLVPATPC